ncbi:hypothetical protein [Rhizobium sp. RAF56]|uniref:hypothetical protein n=1 Tax=Rhizobium sp. RAF56 TaxID=3233062 RepID=UPI003F9A65FC
MVSYYTTTPVHFTNASNQLFFAIETLWQAASNEIDIGLEHLERQLQINPDQLLDNWSIRVSGYGLQIEADPLEVWMGSTEWSAPGFCHNFKPGNTLAALRAAINGHRTSLARLIVFHVMRGVGYEQIYQCDAFTTAVCGTLSAPSLVTCETRNEVPFDLHLVEPVNRNIRL